MHKNGQKGFTLVELIVVISILGILSAFAIPKFISLQSSAKKSTIQGVAGAVEAASSLAHSLSIANGGSASTAISMDGTAVTITNYYPTGDADGITKAVTTSGDISVSSASGTTTFIITGTTNCKVTYAQATSTTSPPVITKTTTGC